MNPFAVESPEVQHAYIAIAEYFDAYSLAAARQTLEKVLKTAGSYRYWRGDPSKVLYFFEKLEGLLLAALTIHRDEGQRRAALAPLAEGEVPCLSAYTQYCGWHHKSDPWYFVPRHLSPDEWANPYRVFGKLAAKGGRRAWRFQVREVQFYTLSASSANDGEDLRFDTLRLYLAFAKLMEAAHLVNVRAVNEIGGEAQPKWKGLSRAGETQPT